MKTLQLISNTNDNATAVSGWRHHYLHYQVIPDVMHRVPASVPRPVLGSRPLHAARRVLRRAPRHRRARAAAAGHPPPGRGRRLGDI